METILRTQIEEFNLDDPTSKPVFSTKLVMVNAWTENFTRGAILEYKRFMYLAATSDEMLSPSHIVDIVWRQHFEFPLSYGTFCRALGKWIEYVPLQGEVGEAASIAKQRTLERYREEFGEPSDLYWVYTDIYQPLNLERNRFSIEAQAGIGVLAFIACTAILSVLLRSFYPVFNTWYFLLGYFFILIGAVFLVNVMSRKWMERWMNNVRSDTILHNLTPDEVVYAKYESVSEVVVGCIECMIADGTLVADARNQLSAGEKSETEDVYERAILDDMTSRAKTGYVKLLRVMETHPLFRSVAVSMDALGDRVFRSTFAGSIFRRNFALLSGVCSVGCAVLIMRIDHGMTVGGMVFYLILYLCASVILLYRSSKLLTRAVITEHYKKRLSAARWQGLSRKWSYVLLINHEYVQGFRQEAEPGAKLKELFMLMFTRGRWGWYGGGWWRW